MVVFIQPQYFGFSTEAYGLFKFNVITVFYLSQHFYVLSFFFIMYFCIKCSDFIHPLSSPCFTALTVTSCVHAQSLTRVGLVATPQTAVLQACLPLGFSGQKTVGWSAISFSIRGDYLEIRTSLLGLLKLI